MTVRYAVGSPATVQPEADIEGRPEVLGVALRTPAFWNDTGNHCEVSCGERRSNLGTARGQGRMCAKEKNDYLRRPKQVRAE